jgi:hypothetical protein
MPPRLPRFLRRLIALFTWRSRDRQMDQEMEFHIQSIVGDCMRSGTSRAEAERAARQRFGSLVRLKSSAMTRRTGTRRAECSRR